MSSRSGQKRRYKNDKHKPNVGDQGRETLMKLDENSPVLKMFEGYAAELDAKHDKYERIVKIGRDVTIESKRIIFFLHKLDLHKDSNEKRGTILTSAHTRLNAVATTFFRTIAEELSGEDNFQYLRAYTAGLQEYIEALTFYEYLNYGNIEHYSKIQNQFKYVDDEEQKTNVLVTPLPATEFILGLADLTGELMRKCINCLGCGNVEDCFTICSFTKNIYVGFLGIGNTSKEVHKKTYVLKQSLEKMELVCYNIRVRGSEVPKHTLAIIATVTAEEKRDDDAEYC